MDSKNIIQLAAKACEERKAHNIKLIEISNVSSLADWILITEGFSDVQVRAIVRSVEELIEKEWKLLPLRKEGVNEAKWALLDYGDVIINVFQPEQRKYYELEAFWSNGNEYQLT